MKNKKIFNIFIKAFCFLFSVMLLFMFTYNFNVSNNFIEVYAEEVTPIEESTITGRYLSDDLLEYLPGAIQNTDDSFDFFNTTGVTPESDIIYNEWLILYELEFKPLSNGGKIYTVTFNLYDYLTFNRSYESSYSMYTDVYGDFSLLSYSNIGMMPELENEFKYYNYPSFVNTTDYSDLFGAMFYFDSHFIFNNDSPLLVGKAPFSQVYYYDSNGGSYSLASYLGYTSTNQITWSNVSQYISMKFIPLSSVVNYAYSNGYNSGYNSGSDDGLNQGRQEGYNVGFNEGYNSAVNYLTNYYTYFPFFNSTFNINCTYFDGFNDTTTYFSNNNSSNLYLRDGKFYLNESLLNIEPEKENGDIIGKIVYNIFLDSRVNLTPRNGYSLYYEPYIGGSDYNDSYDPVINFVSNLGIVYNLRSITSTLYQFTSNLSANEYITSITISYDFTGSTFIPQYLWDFITSKYITTNEDFSSELFDFYYQNGYDVGFENGVDSVYDDIYSEIAEDTYQYGYDDGYDKGYLDGNRVGYSNGYSVGLANDGNMFYSLLSAVVDVPVSAFMGIFQIELFGVDLSVFFLSLAGVCLIIAIIKFFIGLGGK